MAVHLFLITATLIIQDLTDFKTNYRECEFAGVERQTGTVEWTTGVEYWTGLLECHAHKSAHALIKRYLEPWVTDG